MKPNLASVIQQHCPVQAPSQFKSFDKALASFLRYLKADPLELDEEIAKYKNIFEIPTFLGLEVEVENIHNDVPIPTFWKCKNDNSLRNGGVEFFTVPLRPEESLKASAVLWWLLRDATSEKPDFSWRVSNHVHLNALDLTEDELKAVLLLGTFFESLFFSLVGKDREQSMFCVPIQQSLLMDNLGAYLRGKTALHTLVHKWPKYTALNIGRLYERPHEPAIGTVEFRHMGGTSDVKDVLLWQAIIVNLFRASIALSGSELKGRILSINTAPKYHDFVEEVFSHEVAKRLKVKDARGLFSDSVSRMKGLFLPYPKYVPVESDSALVKYTEKVMAEAKKDEKTLKNKMLFGVEFQQEQVATLHSWSTTFISTNSGNV